MKKINYTFVFLILASCHFFNPIGESSMKRVEVKPEKQKLIGEWELDSFSYSFIKEQEKSFTEKTLLVLKEEGKFLLENFPNHDTFGNLTETDFIDVDGEWTIRESSNKEFWDLKLEFKINQDRNRSLVFQLYDKKDLGLILWKSIGDPDSGNRLLFKK
ncbi:hypothetical protein [Winogradskyella luteola]|uniref:Lipocalin-like domain-containing protein n=1 Tax=Winogradskyella luteola TaxID=2828330 RepID=A0A9X1F8W4_9FLAO|nr:hypothetical protein [Winogradskyella luteola]MBV7269339.1 hypothetical protein [Winogradskyella luteola]